MSSLLLTSNCFLCMYLMLLVNFLYFLLMLLFLYYTETERKPCLLQRLGQRNSPSYGGTDLCLMLHFTPNERFCMEHVVLAFLQLCACPSIDVCVWCLFLASHYLLSLQVGLTNILWCHKAYLTHDSNQRRCSISLLREIRECTQLILRNIVRLVWIHLIVEATIKLFWSTTG